jgi:transcriptional regulator with XRE-family HTH domain
MRFKDWVKKSGLSLRSLAKSLGITHSMIRHLMNEKPPMIITIKKLIELSKNMSHPLNYEMFPKAFLRGYSRVVSGKELMELLRKPEK